MDSTVLIFTSLALLVGLVLFAVITRQLNQASLNKEDYQVEWLRISNSVESNNQSSYGMAVINADNLLNKAMSELGIRGSGVGDQLKNGSKKFSDLDGVWSAHKLRNKIAHQHNFDLSSAQVRAALNQFKRALKDLGAI